MPRSISADGRFVAFASDADNLVPDDTSGVRDVFVRDRQTDQTELISVSASGEAANSFSGFAAISADGRYAAFTSLATDMTDDDAEQTHHVFVRDLQAQHTERITDHGDVPPFVQQGTSPSLEPAISGDGRFVAFVSYASNYGFSSLGSIQIFMRDRETGLTELVSVGPDGQPISQNAISHSISADGRFVAFSDISFRALVHDRQTGQTERINIKSDDQPTTNDAITHPSISADGRFVAFQFHCGLFLPCVLAPGDVGGRHIGVHDRQTGQSELVSVNNEGAPGSEWSWFPAISADGRFVAFASDADNLVPDDTNGVRDIFVHDRQTGQTERVSVSSDGEQVQEPAPFTRPAISADGRFVAFAHDADGLVPGDTNGVRDVFVHDRQAGQTERVSVSSDGQQANGPSVHDDGRVAISANGRFVAFGSLASNLVPGDTNGTWDVFIHDRQTGETVRISLSDDDEQGDGASAHPSFSSDARCIAFVSTATNLVPDDTNQTADVFVRDWRTPIPGDLNGDGVVDHADLAILLANWGECPHGEPCPADLNDDNTVDGADLATLLANWRR